MTECKNEFKVQMMFRVRVTLISRFTFFPRKRCRNDRTTAGRTPTRSTMDVVPAVPEAAATSAG